MRELTAFISHRRLDTYDHALLDRLSETLTSMGFRQIFLDTEGMRAGDHYENRIHREISQCDLFIPVLGPNWLEITDARQASGEGDIVVREIRAALRHEKEIVPLLVNGATMPERRLLPPEIADLHFKQAIEVRSSTRSTRLRTLLEPKVRELNRDHRLGDGFAISYFVFAAIGYYLCAVNPHIVGAAEYGLDAWMGMATRWSALFVWPIFFLPFALLALFRPFKVLIEGALNAGGLKDRLSYLTPFFFGLLITVLALAIEINSQYQTPWTVHPRFEPAQNVATCPSGARLPREPERYTSNRLATVVDYDPAGRLAATFQASGGAPPFWLTNTCWPNAFFYLISSEAARPEHAADRARVQAKFVEALLSSHMQANRVPFSRTFWAYAASFGFLILLGGLGVAMAVFFVMVQIRRPRDDSILRLPSEDAYLCLTYAFISLMIWVPFRMITDHIKNKYYTVNMSRPNSDLTPYLNDMIIGIVFTLGFLYLTTGLLFKYKRLALGFLGMTSIILIVGSTGVVMMFGDSVTELAANWQFYVGLSIPSIVLLLALWYQFDPAMVRFNDFKREALRTGRG